MRQEAIMRARRTWTLALLALSLAMPYSAAGSTRRGHRQVRYSYASSRTVVVRHHNRNHALKRKAAWTGAGFAAGRAAGPAGSVAVGTAKHRHDLAAGGHRRNKALVKIGAPVAAGAAFGPAGTVAYEGYEHRRWIKHKLTGRHHRRSA